MVCAFIVVKCEGFSQITDLADYLDNNRLIAHYCGFNIMEPLPFYWTYDRFLRQLDNAELKFVMADLVRQLYETLTAPWVSTRPPTSTMSGGMSSTGDTKAMCW